MKFIDEATIEVKAGRGGPGAKSFRREKFVPFGGPDGGDGGKGGDVIIIGDRNKQTLLDFKFRPLWEAENGAKGEGSRCTGKAGLDLTILVPIGTQIFRAGTSELVADITEHDQRIVLCKGGRGGKGNHFFKSATNRVPEHAQPGEEGEAGAFTLSLKLVADVGLLGFPNAGKSTLISRISEAKPKIADYPFTTLTPHLGVVRGRNGRSFVVADIPGLIPGAHQGRGLGTTFLKHVERTRVLAHLIDPNQLDEQGEPMDPITAFRTINRELELFSPLLAAKRQLVVITKRDTISEDAQLAEITNKFGELGYPVVAISAVAGVGLVELSDALERLIFEPQQ